MTARILTVVNEKGGTGKTTTTVNLAVALQALGNKVLIVNLDPAEKALMVFTEKRVDKPLPLAVREHDLSGLIAQVEGLFDWILIDNAPTMSKLTGDSIALSDICILPVKPSPLDISVSEKTVQLVKASAEAGGKPRAYFLITQQVKGSIPAKDVEDDLKEFGIPVLKSRTSHRMDYIKTLKAGMGVVELNKNNPARLEIEALLQEITNDDS